MKKLCSMCGCALLWAGAALMARVAWGEEPAAVQLPAFLEAPVPATGLGEFAGAFSRFDVVLGPDREEPEWWAGAPSVARGDDGTFWLACRMRTADAPRGLRGYEIRLLRSPDGLRFERAHSIQREDVPIPGFERPCLLRDPASGRFKLYGCGPWQGGPWCIIKFEDAADPTQFRAETARPVIVARPPSYPRDAGPEEYKDPVVIHAAGQYHCYAIGVVRRTERIFHFASPDGEAWAPVGNPYQPIMDLAGWHDFYVRPASVLPLGIGYLFVYEGSSVDWYDPVYNIATGLAFTFDLHRVTELTPDAPLVTSSTPGPLFHTFRYSHWMFVGDEIWVYAEVATPRQTHEIRLFRLPRHE